MMRRGALFIAAVFSIYGALVSQSVDLRPQSVTSATADAYAVIDSNSLATGAMIGTDRKRHNFNYLRLAGER
jgi:hypothetical protein